ncbi:hypothetical protein SARC_03575 [Sphaeroforma arctica JP610]|uniref:Tubby C-terminal domain-containing protein n=1 Tax=Sphaeroforma arctica JP610 TaxID=667725 RepID=A0A0L0G579_9EUKA|nr:hypothetical protein SARC_03575 [Sphaeroforma arctica JP610]KNC84185.1 hypothetical protein SARC_03575 [Sphaeroforma arctica JP610]|eukprot:XP_014158087.1 hypothetical protein SARC_03575 [Sphaeroforma arctica JP610]
MGRFRDRRNSGSGSGSGSGEESSDDEGRPRTYRMREKLIDIGDDYQIMYLKNKIRRKHEFTANNKKARIRTTFHMQTADGDTVYKFHKKKMRLRDTYEIENGDDDEVAKIHKDLVNIIRDKFDVSREDGNDIEIEGSIIRKNYEYKDKETGEVIAKVHDCWIDPVAEAYEIEIEPGQDVAFILTIAAAVEAMSLDDEDGSGSD